jgi:competence protein ComFC
MPLRWRHWGQALADFVLPPYCLLCQRHLRIAVPLCPGCSRGLRRVGGPCCGQCSAPLSAPLSVPLAEAGACVNCADWRPVFERALVLHDFSDAMQQAVHRLKFGGCGRIGWQLGRQLARGFHLELAQVDLLVPVPLHAARQRERGYNQSALIAQGIAQISGVPVKGRLLQRRTATQAQARLTAGQRRDNLEGAFVLRQPGPGAGLVVGLVDDVLSTGTTLNAAATVLRQAGYRVWGLALACPFKRSETQA